MIDYVEYLIKNEIYCAEFRLWIRNDTASPRRFRVPVIINLIGGNWKG